MPGSEQPAQACPQVRPVGDDVDLPLAGEKPAALELGGKLLPDGLADDAGAGETHPAPGLSDDHVRVRRKRCRHPTVGGVGHQADGQQAPFPVPLDGNAGLRHLHQRQAPLLHPSAAGGRHDEQRERLVRGMFDREGNHFPDRRTEAAAQKTEIHDGRDERVAADFCPTAQHRFGQCRLLACGLPAPAVGPGIGEVQDVKGNGFDQQWRETARVEKLIGPLRRCEPIVVTAFGTHEQVASQPPAVDERRAGSATGPGGGRRRGGGALHAASPRGVLSKV